METGNRMSRASRRDYLQRICPRFQKASRPDRQRILDEFCANCSYHRKHAIRLLNRSLPGTPPARQRRVRGRWVQPVRSRTRPPGAAGVETHGHVLACR
jgi:hypothetical protein